MLNTILAVVAVLTITDADAVYKLLRLPFRLLRGFFRHKAAPVQLTAD
jgi:hypothetical protein